jgi:hypothetical protein
MKFNVGDKVRRTDSDFGFAKIGQIYTIKNILFNSLYLDCDPADLFYLPESFELVESCVDIIFNPPKTTGGIKHDDGKPRLDLVSSIWIKGVGQVLGFGAKEYAPHNWRKGLQISRLLAACLRHVFSFLGGENNDKDSGLSHLYHASCCLMFAAEMMETRPDQDDRWKPES